MRIKHIIITALVILGSVMASFGQRVDNGKLSPSLASSGSSDVNVFNGKISLKIPLVTIRGRGEVSLPLYLIEPSTQMTDLGNYWYADPQTGSGQYYPTAQITGSQMNPYIMPMPGIMARATASPFSSGWGGSWMTKLAFESSDGSRYEFFDTQPNSQFNHSVYHKIKTENGINVLRSRGQYFSTKDGSDVRFVSDTPIYDTLGIGANATASFYDIYGYINFPNGTVYRIDKGFVSWLEDKNGNRITVDYNYGSDLNLNGYTVTDSIGRKTIVSNYRDANGTTIEYKGSNGANRLLHILYENVSSGHPDLIGSPITPDIQVWASPAKELILPNGKSYKFFHNKEGLLTRTESSQGGAVEYDHSAITFQIPSMGPDQQYSIYTRVTEKRVYNGSELVSKTTYSFPETPVQDICWGTPFNRVNTEGFVQVKNYSPNVLVSSTKHYFTKWSHPTNCEQRDSMLGTYGVGQEYKTELLDANNNITRIIEKTWENRESMSWWKNPLPIYWGSNSTQNATVPSPYATPSLDARIVEEKVTLVDSNQVSKKTYQYDPTVKYNLVTDVFEYDYGQGESVNFLRRTHTDYIKNDGVYDVNYGRALRGLATESWVSSDIYGNSKVSRTKYEYDNYSGTTNTASLLDRTNITGHNAAYGTNYMTRGNVTKVTSFADAQNQTGAVSVHSQYDIAGNVIKAIDAKGYTSTIDYTDRFGSSDGEAQSNTPPTQLNGQSTFAFPTSGTNDKGWIIGYTQYDYFIGANVDAEDINGVVDTAFYNDSLDRQTQIIGANNIANSRSQKTINYDDLARKVTTTSDIFSFGDNLSKSEEIRDKLGRVVEKRSYEANNIYVATLMEYDSLGRVTRATSPFRPLQNETPLWSETKYDALGRTIEVQTPDGTKSLTAYTGNAVLTTDRAERQRRSVYNALGQLVRVDEPNAQGVVGNIDTPFQPTFYQYNTTGQMVEVTQGVQKRQFLFDNLGRLLRIKQPEQEINSALNTTLSQGNNVWTSGFTYDDNGNVLTATDAKGITMVKTYDNLNRVLTQSYSDGTPTITNKYDESGVPFSKGRLTELSSSISTTRINTFDALGRTLNNQQITDGQTYTSSYQYNLSGALIQETYPSGRVVRNEFGIDGKMTRVSGQLGVRSTTYANSFSYKATGGIERMKLGNGLWESAKYNPRQQITEISLGFSASDASAWKVNYEYGKIEDDGSLNQLKNTGDLARQTISFQGLAQPFVQTYKYDSLDRLTEAKELSGTQQNWKQNWTYDIYGNRTGFNQIIGTQTMVSNNLTAPAISTQSNRFNLGQGYTYDKNGNLIQDAQNRSFTFNGDNKQTVARDLNIPTTTQNPDANVIGKYFYDGEGKRVKKVTSTETTIFVYSSSKLVAEYSTGTVQNPQTSYLTTDNLGSPRVITNQNRTVISRRDFMPFGDDLNAGIGARSTALKYSSTGQDDIRQRFTGYQKDNETGLDFAQARYYYNSHGRFTAVDPLLASGKSANPQTFNRYTYVMNNPFQHIDTNGLDPGELSFEAFVKIVASVFVSVNTLDGKESASFTRSAIREIATILYPSAKELYKNAYNAERVAIRAAANEGIVTTGDTTQLSRAEVIKPATTVTGTGTFTAGATSTGGVPGGSATSGASLSGTTPTNNGQASANQVQTTAKDVGREMRSNVLATPEAIANRLDTAVSNVVTSPARVMVSNTNPLGSSNPPGISLQPASAPGYRLTETSANQSIQEVGNRVIRAADAEASQQPTTPVRAPIPVQQTIPPPPKIGPPE